MAALETEKIVDILGTIHVFGDFLLPKAVQLHTRKPKTLAHIGQHACKETNGK